LPDLFFSLSDLKISFNFAKNDGLRVFLPLPRRELNREGEDGADTLGKTIGVEAAGLPLDSLFGNVDGADESVSSGSATAVVPLSDLASAIGASPTST